MALSWPVAAPTKSEEPPLDEGISPPQICDTGPGSGARAATGIGKAPFDVTNSAGDSVHVIDPATNKVKERCRPDGVNFSPDGVQVYISNEETSTLDVYDRKTAKLIKKVELSDHPNNIGVTKNGERIVVAIARGKGGIDVVDAEALTLKKTISTNGGRLHNVYVTPDGKYVIRFDPVQEALCLRSCERGTR